MTKKTNAIILRQGYNSFWDNKDFLFISSFNKINFKNLIKKELEKWSILIIDCIFFQNTFHLNIFNENKMKEQIIKNSIIMFYKKTLSFFKTKIYFGIEDEQLFKILSVDRLFISFYSNSNLNRSFFICKQILIYYYINIIKYLIVNWIFENKNNKIFINLLFLFPFKKVVIQSFKINQHFFIKKVKLKKNFNLFFNIKLKIISIKLEFLIFTLYKSIVNIFIENIFKMNYYEYRWPSNLFNKKIELDLFYKIFLTCNYIKPSIICFYIANNLEKTKNHLKVLSKFSSFFSILFYKNIITILGLKLHVTGKIGGKLRKSKYKWIIGTTSLQKFSLNINYSLVLSFTKYGVFSVKIWLIYEK